MSDFLRRAAAQILGTPLVASAVRRVQIRVHTLAEGEDGRKYINYSIEGRGGSVPLGGTIEIECEVRAEAVFGTGQELLQLPPSTEGEGD